MPITDRELKEAALAGLRHERQRLDDMIQRLQRELAPRPASTAAPPVPRKRRMSAEGRQRIIAATKKRWAAVRAAKAAADAEAARPKPSTKKAAVRPVAPGSTPKKAAKTGARKPAQKKAGSRGRAKAARAAKKAAPETPAPMAGVEQVPAPAVEPVEAQAQAVTAS